MPIVVEKAAREDEHPLDRIAGGDYDFLDFGCSKGGSLRLGMELFGGERGLGIDFDPAKVAASRAAGHDAVLADVTALDLDAGAVSFVLLMHFLEHLAGFDTARKALNSACRVARDFVFIRHPWFDSDAALFDMGFKFYWSDWHGHPNRFGKIDFFKVLSRSKRVHRWFLLGYDRLEDTLSTDLIALSGPLDSQGATEDDMAVRVRRPIPFQTYRQIACLVQINPEFEVRDVLAELKQRRHELIHDSWSGRGAAGSDDAASGR